MSFAFYNSDKPGPGIAIADNRLWGAVPRDIGLGDVVRLSPNEKMTDRRLRRLFTQGDFIISGIETQQDMPKKVDLYVNLTPVNIWKPGIPTNPNHNPVALLMVLDVKDHNDFEKLDIARTGKSVFGRSAIKEMPSVGDRVGLAVNRFKYVTPVVRGLNIYIEDGAPVPKFLTRVDDAATWLDMDTARGEMSMFSGRRRQPSHVLRAGPA